MIHPFKGLRPTCIKANELITQINNPLFNFNSNLLSDSYLELQKFVQEQKQQTTKKYFVQDQQPCFYIYRIISKEKVQTGLIALLELKKDSHYIYAHENIHQHKVTSYRKFLESSNIQANPIILLHQNMKPVQLLLNQLTIQSPDFTISCNNDHVHQLWHISDTTKIKRIKESYNIISKFVIADGHHRYNAINNYSENEKKFLLSWLISNDQAHLEPYHWIIPSLNNINKSGFLEKVNQFFEIYPQITSNGSINQNQHFGLYLDNNCYRLQIKKPTKIDSQNQKNLKFKTHDINFLYQFLTKELSINNIVGIHGSTDKLLKTINLYTYHSAISLPQINVDDILINIKLGNILPVSTTYFSLKPAIGLISFQNNCMPDLYKLPQELNNHIFLEKLKG